MAEEKKPPKPPIASLAIPDAPFNDYAYGRLRETMIKVNEVINRLNED